jgi:hypothetical protein
MRILNRTYQAALHLYPAEFRRDFGAEMSDVFSTQLTEATTPRELLAICWYAFTELLTLALPMRAVDPKLIAPAVSLLGTPAVLFPLVWALNNPRTLNLLTRNVFGPYH